MNDLAAAKGGIVLTAHLGNYDLGAAICRAGLLIPEQLHELFLDRSISGVTELHGWKEGTFSFHPGDQNEGHRTALGFVFDLQRLVLEIVRRADEQRLIGTQ